MGRLAQHKPLQIAQPSTRPLRCDERMMTAKDCARVYRRREGDVRRLIKNKLLPAKNTGTSQRAVWQVHPDDACRVLWVELPTVRGAK